MHLVGAFQGSQMLSLLRFYNFEHRTTFNGLFSFGCRKKLIPIQGQLLCLLAEKQSGVIRALVVTRLCVFLNYGFCCRKRSTDNFMRILLKDTLFLHLIFAPVIVILMHIDRIPQIRYDYTSLYYELSPASVYCISLFLFSTLDPCSLDWCCSPNDVALTAVQKSSCAVFCHLMPLNSLTPQISLQAPSPPFTSVEDFRPLPLLPGAGGDGWRCYVGWELIASHAAPLPSPLPVSGGHWGVHHLPRWKIHLMTLPPVWQHYYSWNEALKWTSLY